MVIVPAPVLSPLNGVTIALGPAHHSVRGAWILLCKVYLRHRSGMFLVMRAALVVLYVTALASLVIPMPAYVATVAQGLTVLLLVVHAVEVPVFFRLIRRYEGGVASSVGLTLLFGFLHWLPLRGPEG